MAGGGVTPGGGYNGGPSGPALPSALGTAGPLGPPLSPRFQGWRETDQESRNASKTHVYRTTSNGGEGATLQRRLLAPAVHPEVQSARDVHVGKASVLQEGFNFRLRGALRDL
jgi:hypothetical protein